MKRANVKQFKRTKRQPGHGTNTAYFAQRGWNDAIDYIRASGLRRMQPKTNLEERRIQLAKDKREAKRLTLMARGHL